MCSHQWHVVPLGRGAQRRGLLDPARELSHLLREFQDLRYSEPGLEARVLGGQVSLPLWIPNPESRYTSRAGAYQGLLKWRAQILLPRPKSGTEDKNQISLLYIGNIKIHREDPTTWDLSPGWLD